MFIQTPHPNRDQINPVLSGVCLYPRTHDLGEGRTRPQSRADDRSEKDEVGFECVMPNAFTAFAKL